jgi:hypothetical protein
MSSNISDSVDDEQFFNEDEAGAGPESEAMGGGGFQEEEAGAGTENMAIRGDFKCDLSVEGEDVEVIRVPPAANVNAMPVEPPKRKDLFRVPPSMTSARALPVEPPQMPLKEKSRVPVAATAITSSSSASILPEFLKETARVPTNVRALPADPPQRKETTIHRVPTISMPEKRKEVSQEPAAKVVPRLEPRVMDRDDGGYRLSPTPNTTSASVADSTILAMSMLSMKPEDVPTFLLDCT